MDFMDNLYDSLSSVIPGVHVHLVHDIGSMSTAIEIVPITRSFQDAPLSLMEHSAIFVWNGADEVVIVTVISEDRTISKQFMSEDCRRSQYIICLF